MRVLYVCGGGILGGLEKITLQIITATRARGHEVLCLGSHWQGQDFTRGVRARGIPLERSWLGFISLSPRWKPIVMTLAQLRRLPALWLDFRRTVRAWHPDIVHHTNFHHAFLLACDPARQSVPSLYHVHNIFAPTLLVRLAMRVIARRVDGFVAVSDAVAESLVRIGIDRRRITVVLNGVPEPDPCARAGLRWRHDHGWTDDDVVVGIVGQVGEWKGHEDFVNAVALARRSNARVSGVVVGSGSNGFITRLRDLSTTSTAGVVFTGFMRSVDAVYQGLDVVVVPSRHDDPCPLAVAEAMAHGVPVIATRRGGIPELLGLELADWLVPAESPVVLADRIRALAADVTLRKDVGARGRARVEQHLTLDRCVNELLRHYALLTGKSVRVDALPAARARAEGQVNQ